MRFSAFTKVKFLLVVVVLTLVAVAIWFVCVRTGSDQEIRHIILISIDTCRADRLSCYGFNAKTTPNIDALAEEGVIFNRVAAPAPLTLPSHSSIMTGTIPPYHGVRDNDQFQLGQYNLTLAEILQARGYTTGAVVGSFVLDSQFGLDQGFDSYDDTFEEVLEDQPQIQRRGGEVTRQGLKWLGEHKDEDFFLFLHYFDPHGEYNAPEPFASDPRFGAYAAEVAYADHCIGKIFDELKRLKLYDGALIIVTSDHGESLGEHQEETHSYFIYQSTIRVPLIFKLPGKNKGRRIDDFVGLVDIMPTTLALTGIDIPSPVHGQDLSRYFQQEQYSQQDRYIYCESLNPTRYGCAGLRSVISYPWQYIHTSRAELYNLQQDPKQENNVIAQNTQQAEVMKKHLKNILSRQSRDDTRASVLEIDDESVKKLESLGYISSGEVNDSFETVSDREDPKDFLPLYEIQRQVKDFIRVKMYDKARQGAVELVEARPDNADFRLLLGQVAFEQNDFAEAITQLSRSARIRPDDHKAYLRLGEVYFKQNLQDLAIAEFQKAIKLKPSVDGYHRLAEIAMKQKKIDDALSYYQKVIEIDPTDIIAHHKLGLTCLSRGQVSKAVYHFDQVLKGDNNNSNDHVYLAIAHAQLKNFEQAEKHFEEAIRIDPDNANAHGSYANTLLQQEKLELALKHFKNVARIRPMHFLPQSNIAMIYFRMGKMDQAIESLQQAINLAKAANQPEVVKQLQDQLAQYKIRRPNP